MSQPRVLSAFEALTNVLVGYGLAVALQLTLLPMIGLSVTAAQSLQLGGAFTFASLVRSYALRRLFARLGGGP